MNHAVAAGPDRRKLLVSHRRVTSPATKRFITIYAFRHCRKILDGTQRTWSEARTCGAIQDTPPLHDGGQPPCHTKGEVRQKELSARNTGRHSRDFTCNELACKLQGLEQLTSRYFTTANEQQSKLRPLHHGTSLLTSGLQTTKKSDQRQGKRRTRGLNHSPLLIFR